MKRAGSLRSRSAPVRHTPIKKANRKRKAANLDRAHGPAERREWIKTLPCANCGIVGFSDGAHIKNGGMSRKANARFTIPLCRTRMESWSVGPGWLKVGCHNYQHDVNGGWNMLPALDTPEKREAAAARIENLWQSHLRQTGRARQDTE